jgi:hypothetical protein
MVTGIAGVKNRKPKPKGEKSQLWAWTNNPKIGGRCRSLGWTHGIGPKKKPGAFPRRFSDKMNLSIRRSYSPR